MATYFDSSLILSSIFEERDDIEYDSVWQQETTRLSSNLLRIECIVGIRRVGALQNLAPDNPWVMQRISSLEDYLSLINLKYLDQDIEEVIKTESRLSNCRTLDAIHLATAEYFRPKLDENLFICTLDQRIRKVAERLGFPVLPIKITK